MESGRITYAVCRALKARVLLTANEYAGLLPVVAELIGKFALNTAGDTPYLDLFSGKAEPSDAIFLSIPREPTTGSV